MHLGNNRIQYRRAGRHFDHGDTGAHTVGNGLENPSCLNGYFMAAAFTVIFILQHDQQITFPGTLAEIVMAYHPVEIKRLRSTGIGDHCGDFGYCLNSLSHLQYDVGCIRHSRTFRHVDNH